MSSGRRAVTAGSFWRTAPAAALRGLAKAASPASSSSRGGREGAAQHHRDGPDRSQVRGDVLADPAVTARRAADEAPPLVEERHTEAVDLRLADVREPGAGDRAADARLELAQVAGTRGVVEREHRHAVLDGLEQVGR